MAELYARPKEGLHICVMSRGFAEEHTRRAHNVPDDVMLGWKPYTILVTSYGGIAHTAFHSMRELRRWLGPNYRVSLARRWSARAMRSGTILSA